MRWPIRNQILFPYATTLLVAVMLIAVTTAYLAARRSREESLGRIRSVVETLGQSSFPYTANVVEKMRGLSGAHFMAVDANGHVLASTLSASIRPQTISRQTPVSATIETLTDFPSVDVGGTQYFVAHVRTTRMGTPTSLYALYPEEDLFRLQWDAAWPPLAVGAATIGLMALISVTLARRLDRRIRSVRELFAKLADGHFDHASPGEVDDEICDLVLSANRLSDRLSTMRDQISRTERLRLLAQLAGGLAHQLRNAVTGAQMAIQLHQRRCDSAGDRESLQVALQQLKLTEEQIKGLLSLGKERVERPRPAEVRALLDEVTSLIDPVCRHTHIDFQYTSDLGDRALCVASGDDLKAAVVNLILNAIEAAGIGGSVRLAANCSDRMLEIDVCDSGMGPPDELKDRISEPFVSSKAEGVGLGLSLAEMAATTHGGTLTWKREDARTVFTLRVPAVSDEVAEPTDAAMAGSPESPSEVPQGVSAE